MDSNYPEVTLAAAAMILGAADRIRRDGLEVLPDDGVLAFEVTGDVLRVPGFGRLGGELLHSAVTGGASDETVAAYLDSILEFAGAEDERLAALFRHRGNTGVYPTTEAAILEDYDGHLSEEEGLRLVLEACDELETQVSHLSRSQRHREEPADVS
jgi:carboxylate-amine ligase